MESLAFWECPDCGFTANPLISKVCLNCSTGGLKPQTPFPLDHPHVVQQTPLTSPGQYGTQPGT